VLKAGALPVVLGGDDSIPIPVLAAFRTGRALLYILQLDAHIDWRDEVKGVGDGYSSTMRRASEMPWVKRHRAGGGARGGERPQRGMPSGS
jgi:agmatinase